MNGFPSATAHRPLRAPIADSPLAPVVESASNSLLKLQRDDGHWVGELQGDSILESEYILLMAFLGREDDPRIKQAANYLLHVQMLEGGWANYPGGPAEVSTTVKAYFALKIAGQSPESDEMKKAAAVVRLLGGAEACNSFTKFYLAMLGQTPYANCPAVPPEIVLLPRWFYFNIYAISAWSRTILVPLSVVWAHKPIRKLPEEHGIRELYFESPQTVRPPHPWSRGWFTWNNFFLRIDKWLKRLERWKVTTLRPRAVHKAVAWIRERNADSDGLGAIFPPMIYNVIVLRCLGIADDDPEMIWAMKQIEDLMIFEKDTLRLQPCVSPVWDTSLSLIALADAAEFRNSEFGIRNENRVLESEFRIPNSALGKAVRWLLDREIRRPGDWCRSAPRLEPGGWCFEYRNGFYPDTDDTSMVLIALARTGHSTSPEARPAVKRAIDWLIGMQNRDGGWGAFDRNINREVLTKVPFADHNAMLDPSCADITARVLEALGHYGYGPDERFVDRALSFIERTQQAEGSWLGRWGGQLHLWNLASSRRPEAHRLRHEIANGSPCGDVAQEHSTDERRLGRIVPQLR